MTIQQTSGATGLGAGLDLPRRQSVAKPGKPVRRLPVHKDWPLSVILAVQIGILVVAVALWEAAADLGWIDGFFWSKPSDIFDTLIKFFATGAAWTDMPDPKILGVEGVGRCGGSGHEQEYIFLYRNMSSRQTLKTACFLISVIVNYITIDRSSISAAFPRSRTRSKRI